MSAGGRHPFAPPPLQRLRRYYERLRPLAAHRYFRPRLVGLCLSLAIAAEGSRRSCFASVSVSPVSVSTNCSTHFIHDPPAGNDPTGHIASVPIPTVSGHSPS